MADTNASRKLAELSGQPVAEADVAQGPAEPVPVIKCLGLSKVYRDFWFRRSITAVNNVDLTVNEGEVFGLLGPNGSGKSTTIKMILGLLTPTSGRIAVLGQTPSDVKIKHRIGYLPEETYLYQFLTAKETLDHFGQLFGLPRHARKERTEMLLDMVGLKHAAHRAVGEFSKGMQRKIGLAQALINDPDLLILDEPTSGMDPVAANDVKRLIRTLARRGKTVLLCSHLLGDVQDLADRAAIMFGGRLRAEGTLDQLLVDEETTTIKTQHLDDAAINSIESILEQQGRFIESVAHPRQSLEEKFLEIVTAAQAEGISTTGARSGGALADFLADREEKEAAESAAEPEKRQSVLDRLTQAEAPTKAGSDEQTVAATEANDVDKPTEQVVETGSENQKEEDSGSPSEAPIPQSKSVNRDLLNKLTQSEQTQNSGDDSA